jgi:hypothetical protein
MTPILLGRLTCPLGDSALGRRMHSRTKAFGTPPIPCGIAPVV